jgi:pimeloyl-ACP methyl ester carboxylesterase
MIPVAWALSLFSALCACGGDDEPNGDPESDEGARGGGAEPSAADPNVGESDGSEPATGSVGEGDASEGSPSAGSASEGNAAENDAALDPADRVETAAPPAVSPEPAVAPPTPSLAWVPCGDDFECADARVPRDYAEPLGPQYRVAVTRLPARDSARRIGPLFVNFGGPGGDAVATLQAVGADAFRTLSERFDLIAIDPRGVGRSEAAIDCRVDQETEGLYANPFLKPSNLDVNFWMARAERYVDACVQENLDVSRLVSTANVARDMDLVRAALGEEQLSYLGLSYGSFLGATYAALFPQSYRALVLDGALDADQYINRPSEGLREQSAAFEVALARFFQACEDDPDACSGFGGADPRQTFDELVSATNAFPVNVPGTGRVLDGDDILMGAVSALYNKASWSVLAESLAALENGDPRPLRAFADASYGREGDGTFAPITDRYFVLSAAEQTYSGDLDAMLASGAAAATDFEHFFWNTGYAELPLGLFPGRSSGIYNGPFVASTAAPSILVVATTNDPATPYQGSVRLVESLGNARLLTMIGDGHTAYGGNSPCIDSAVEAYLEAGVVPELGTECEQTVPFQALLSSDNRAAFSSTPIDGAPVTAERATSLASHLIVRGRLITF